MIRNKNVCVIRKENIFNIHFVKLLMNIKKPIVFIYIEL